MTTIQTAGSMLGMELPDQAIDGDGLPWVPQGDRVWFRPLRFDLASGRWVNLLKITREGRVNRHRHVGGQVVLAVCLIRARSAAAPPPW